MVDMPPAPKEQLPGNVPPTPSDIIAPQGPRSLVWHWARTVGVVVVLLVLTGAIVEGGWHYFGKPYYISSKLHSAENSFNNNNINDAIQQTVSVIQGDPENVQAFIDLSLFLSQKGSTEFKEVEYGSKAVVVANEAIKLAPNSSEAWRALGYAYEIQQNYPEAHKDYAKSLSFNPTNIRTLFADAHTYDLEGKNGEAEQGYRRVIAADTSFTPAHAGLGRILIQKNDKNGALDEFMMVYKGTKNKHDKAEAAYSIAMIDNVERKFEDAQKYAEEATVLDPTYPLGWYGVGAVFYARASEPSKTLTIKDRLELLNKSTVMMKDAIGLYPNQSAAYLQLAINFSYLGQFKTTFEILDKAQQVAPNDITLSTKEKLEMIKRIQEIRNTYAELSKKVPATPPKK